MDKETKKTTKDLLKGLDDKPKVKTLLLDIVREGEKRRIRRQRDQR